MNGTTTDSTGGTSMTDLLTSLTGSITSVANAYAASQTGGGGTSMPAPPMVQTATGSGSKMLEYGAIALLIGVAVFALAKRKK